MLRIVRRTFLEVWSQGSADVHFEAGIASDAQLLRGIIPAKLYRQTEFRANPSHRKKNYVGTLMFKVNVAKCYLHVYVIVHDVWSLPCDFLYAILKD